MGDYIALKKAVKATGLHPNTLRKYADNGTIPHFRQPSGDRMFDVSGLLKSKEFVICYARVSTVKQKQDLDRQAEVLKKHYPDAEVVRDIGSGLNFKRKGLRSLLERILQGEKLTIVVTYRDRLARFGFDVIEYIASKHGGKIVVLNSIETSPESELVADLTAIITVFSSRLHGLRSYKNKKDLIKTFKSPAAEIKKLDGSL